MRRGTILVTGAAGFIGSHTVLALWERGFDVVGLDDYSNAERSLVGRIEALGQRTLTMIEGDVRDGDSLAAALRAPDIVGAIHFAARKSIEESFLETQSYYDVNVAGTLAVLQQCQLAGVNALVFSSSATVYDPAQPAPVNETGQTLGASPYGRSKLIGERMLRDAAQAFGRRYAILRYFNPVGAHPSGCIGENPRGRPGNLMPVVCRVAAGRQSQLSVFGNDYPTIDGTGVRDYVHVQDVAEAHVHALEALLDGCEALSLNIGTGRGTSVLTLIDAFERANGVRVPFAIAPRRQGDVAAMVANVDQAERSIGWRAKRDLDAMCRDAWRFAQTLA